MSITADNLVNDPKSGRIRATGNVSARQKNQPTLRTQELEFDIVGDAANR